MTKRFALGVAALTAVLLAPHAAADEAATIRAALAKVLPDERVTSVHATPIDGLFQVEIGPQVMYMTGDGRYLIDGAIVDLETRENLAEAAQEKARLRAMEALGEDTMIVFESPDPQHEVTVFTDIDCGYCRKLHEQIDAYGEEGITVRYLAYPRTGVGSPSFKKAVQVWCSDDRQQALTRAKSGQSVEGGTGCMNPVEKHMELGQSIGIRGTPAIILEDGQMLPGFVDPKRLAKLLEQDRQAAN